MLRYIKGAIREIKGILNFEYIRKPDFSHLDSKLDYQNYWEHRILKLRDYFKPREKIFFKWIEPKSKVLDVGCGNSPLLLQLKTKKGCKVQGIDIGKKIVAIQKKAGVPCKIIDITKEKIPGHYDYAIISEVLEHLKYPEDILRKINAKYFIVSVPNTAFIPYRYGLAIKGRFPTQWVYHPAEHLRYWSHTDFLDWLRALNLKIIKTESSSGIYGLKNLWKNMFGTQICYLCKKCE